MCINGIVLGLYQYLVGLTSRENAVGTSLQTLPVCPCGVVE